MWERLITWENTLALAGGLVGFGLFWGLLLLTFEPPSWWLFSRDSWFGVVFGLAVLSLPVHVGLGYLIGHRLDRVRQSRRSGEERGEHRD